MAKFKATDYLRYSYADGRQVESDSIQNQKRLIAEFVKNHPDIELVTERIDDGYSGILFDRPAFSEMMQDIKDGKINCVIVKDLSRLGREYIETGRYLRQVFPAYGVRFIAINDGIDTINESFGDELTTSMKTIINDSYCHDISVKTRSALKSKRMSGEFVGACPIYGYRKSEENKNQLVVDDFAARVVQDIFRMKLDGSSAAKIADELNRMGILSPLAYKINRGLPHPKGGFSDSKDAKWSATSVLRILKDENYTGTLVQGRQGTHNYKIKDLINKPADEWMRTYNAHEAIIRKHDFDLVQKIVKLDTRTTPGGDKVYLFSGILICGCCGARMTRKSVPYKDKSYYYYYCPTGKKKGCEKPVMLKENDLEDCVLSFLQSHIQNVASLEEHLSNVDEETIKHQQLESCKERIKDNNIQLEQITRFKATLYENFVSNFLTHDEYKAYKDVYDDEIANLKQAIDALRQEMLEVTNNSSERLKWTAHFKQFATMTELDRRAVIGLIQSIRVVSKKDLQITFRYQMEYESALSELAHYHAPEPLSLPVDVAEVTERKEAV